MTLMTLMTPLRTALVLFLALLAPFVHAADDAIHLTPIQIGEHSWYFQGESGAASAANKGFMSNAGFVVTGDQVVVLDSLGSPALGQAMIEAIRKITPLPIKLVVASHTMPTTSTDCRPSRPSAPRSGRTRIRPSTWPATWPSSAWPSAVTNCSPG